MPVSRGPRRSWAVRLPRKQCEATHLHIGHNWSGPTDDLYKWDGQEWVRMVSQKVHATYYCYGIPLIHEDRDWLQELAHTAPAICGSGTGGGEICYLPQGHIGAHDPDAHLY